MVRCGEEREILLMECKAKVVEVLGEELGEQVWHNIYLSARDLTAHLDAVTNFGQGPGNMQKYLDTTCSEKFFELIHATIMEIPDGQRG